MNIGHDFGVIELTTKAIEKAIPCLVKKAQAFEDKNGIIGNNVNAKKLAAYKWELQRRKL